MSSALRPCLRPSSLPSLPQSTARTTYICQSCRHARLLRRPKRPYTFTQLVTLSDGSAFTMRTTSPLPVYRSTRDSRNAPLWNPRSKELLNVEDDEAGRLAGFRARFGTMFDAAKESGEDQEPAAMSDTAKKDSDDAAKEEDLEEDEFAEDDSNLLDLISSYGIDSEPAQKRAPAGGSDSKKGGKKK